MGGAPHQPREQSRDGRREARSVLRGCGPLVRSRRLHAVFRGHRRQAGAVRRALSRRWSKQTCCGRTRWRERTPTLSHFNAGQRQLIKVIVVGSRVQQDAREGDNEVHQGLAGLERAANRIRVFLRTPVYVQRRPALVVDLFSHRGRHCSGSIATIHAPSTVRADTRRLCDDSMLSACSQRDGVPSRGSSCSAARGACQNPFLHDEQPPKQAAHERQSCTNECTGAEHAERAAARGLITLLGADCGDIPVGQVDLLFR